jgi:TPR repeat protein
MPENERASSQIQLRVSRKRKAAYVRAAKPGPLAGWCFKHLDAASGFTEPPK